MNPQNVLSIIVRNRSGVLTKIAGMFYRRHCNIETLTVGKTQYEGLSKIVITLPMPPDDLELLRRQIENLVDVYEVRLLDSHRSIQMEMCLIRIAYTSPAERLEIMASANPYRPRIRGTADGTVTMEVAERPEIVDDFVAVMSRHTIEGISRTGMTAIGPPRSASGDGHAVGDPAAVHQLDDYATRTTYPMGGRQ
jgi:acetolactate synthase-1/3 small subunit